MRSICVVTVIASILILGFGTQDVYAPEEPEKLNLGGTGYNSDTNQFEIKILVHLPKEADHRNFSVDTSFEFFKEDGIPIRATVNVPVPEAVKEGGDNNSVHKIVGKIPYNPSKDVLGENIRVLFSADLLDHSGNKISGAAKFHNITLKRG